MAALVVLSPCTALAAHVLPMQHKGCRQAPIQEQSVCTWQWTTAAMLRAASTRDSQRLWDACFLDTSHRSHRLSSGVSAWSRDPSMAAPAEGFCIHVKMWHTHCKAQIAVQAMEPPKGHAQVVHSCLSAGLQPQLGHLCDPQGISSCHCHRIQLRSLQAITKDLNTCSMIVPAVDHEHSETEQRKALCIAAACRPCRQPPAISPARLHKRSCLFTCPPSGDTRDPQLQTEAQLNLKRSECCYQGKCSKCPT